MTNCTAKIETVRTVTTLFHVMMVGFKPLPYYFLRIEPEFATSAGNCLLMQLLLGCHITAKTSEQLFQFQGSESLLLKT